MGNINENFRIDLEDSENVLEIGHKKYEDANKRYKEVDLRKKKNPEI
jgi:hypothetical protein